MKFKWLRDRSTLDFTRTQLENKLECSEAQVKLCKLETDDFRERLQRNQEHTDSQKRQLKTMNANYQSLNEKYRLQCVANKSMKSEISRQDSELANTRQEMKLAQTQVKEQEAELERHLQMKRAADEIVVALQSKEQEQAERLNKQLREIDQLRIEKKAAVDKVVAVVEQRGIPMSVRLVFLFCFFV